MASKTVIAMIRQRLNDGTINVYIKELESQLVSERMGPEQVEQIPTQDEHAIAVAMRDGTFKEEDAC
jgi:hypothetical protein